MNKEPKDPTKAVTTLVVDLAYALWNKELPNDPDQKKLTYKSWHLVLVDARAVFSFGFIFLFWRGRARGVLRVVVL